jgi:outer membrane biosynthesis protein TonB
VGDRSGEQRHHLHHRDAHRAIWIRTSEPVLHGTLREQPLELAMQRATTVKKYARAITFVLAMGTGGAVQARAQSNLPPGSKRQAKHLVQPLLSDLAKKLNLTGTVRIEIVIAPDGTVKRTRVVGGHPVLAADAERAAEKSTFEPGPTDTTEIIEFKF